MPVGRFCTQTGSGFAFADYYGAFVMDNVDLGSVFLGLHCQIRIALHGAVDRMAKRILIHLVLHAQFHPEGVLKQIVACI